MIVIWWVTAFQLTELFVSSLVHLSYGFYLFSTAVAGDVSQSVTNWIFKPKFEGYKEIKSSNDLPPIVLVHGIFGFGKGRLGGHSYFAGAEKKDDRVLVPDLGSLTSIYDRARELFYYLKGGQVDYGKEHSKACGHAQFGRVYEQGHYLEWDEDHPIHFVGHSAGAQVVRVLHQMLADKAFKGYENTSENWILSITSLSGALNGTTRTYFDGMLLEDEKLIMPVSLLQLCRIGVIVYEWLDIPWMKDYYNFGFDHFSMTWRKVGIRGLLDYLLGNAGPFASGDWILPDLTIQGSIKLNRHLRTFPQTYYFSYATKHTINVIGFAVPSGIRGIHPLLFIRVLQMSQWRHPQHVSPPYKGYRDEDWWDNDGALNTISMTHPRLPVEHPSCLVIKDSDCQPLQSGIWYYKIIEGDHIFFVVNRERAGVQFDLIYDSIFQRCRKHDLRKTTALPNQGCDGSILLDTTPTGGKIEKLSPSNGITVKGFELIDEIKAELEENCPGIVSCSDVLAYLSRDAFVASGLPHYEVSGGRRDGMESRVENVVGNLPLPDDTVDQMIQLFNRKGLNAEDLVVLIGAHSIGVAHCFNFLYRMDTPEKAQMVDPRLGSVMKFTCTGQMSTIAFDATTQYKMDSVFYKQLLMKKGLLESDQALTQDIRTRVLVQRFSNDEVVWFKKFGVAMNKLGAVEVLTGNQGQIRKQCRAVNL